MKSKYAKLVFTSILVSLATQLPAASEEGSALYLWLYQNIVLVMGALVIAITLGALYHSYALLMATQRMRLLEEHGIEVLEKVQVLNQTPLWKRLYKQMTKVVPIEKEKDIMLDHDYDGIKELDNILPPWWVALFYASIAIGVAYYSYYHIFDYGPSSAQAYETEMEAAEAAVKAYLAQQADVVDENTVTLLSDPSAISLGETLFKEKCTPCHGQMGEGNSIGPNLTDAYWLNGGGVKNVFKTIKYGVPEKGMISWRSQLRPGDMQKVASFIISLQGSNPPNGKAPQGELWQTEETSGVPEEEGPLGFK